MFNLFKNKAKLNEELKTALKEGAFLVDVRTPGEFKEGTAGNAVNIPLKEVGEKIKDFENKPGVVVFCHSGNRSGMAKHILENQGIQNVINGGSVQEVEDALDKE